MNIRDFLDSFQKKAEEPKPDNAVELLKGDHRLVESLFAKFEESSKAAEKKKIMGLIIDELTTHAAVEEKLVYPILDGADHDLAGEAVQEHHVVKFLLRELKNADGITDEIEAKVKVLKEIVEHHVKEEESEMFPKLESTDTDLNELGAEIKAKKADLKAKVKTKKAAARATVRKTKPARKPAKKAS